jgi:hypothetical protein
MVTTSFITTIFKLAGPKNGFFLATILQKSWVFGGRIRC